MTESNTALALHDHEQPAGLVMVVSPSEARRRLEELRAFVRSVMVKDVDYGKIPGTDKDSLYQPGAQKLAEIYGFATSFEDVESVQDWDKPFFLYRKRCVLTSARDGRFVASGVGSCNSREDRYAWRWVFENEIPKGVDKVSLRNKTRRSKNGKPYTTFRVPTEDIYSVVNTLEKMACKRALVHAVIGATRSSGIFTQDVEDMPPELFQREPEETGEIIEMPRPKSDKTLVAQYKARIAEAENERDSDALDQISKDVRASVKDGSISEEDREQLRKDFMRAMSVLGKP
jgi:hypothetical protein